MNDTERTIIKTMDHADGTNWTPLAIAERTGEKREYVKFLMWDMAQDGQLEQVSRGLYRVPR